MSNFHLAGCFDADLGTASGAPGCMSLDSAISITVGSSIQVALLVAPLLVIVSHFMGRPMNLVFENPLELIAIAAVAFTVNAITEDGETTWFEGVLLVAVYIILGMAFFFLKE